MSRKQRDFTLEDIILSQPKDDEEKHLLPSASRRVEQQQDEEMVDKAISGFFYLICLCWIGDVYSYCKKK